MARAFQPSPVDAPAQPTLLVWMPPREYSAMSPRWDNRFVWCPLPVDSSLPIERTSFIRVDDATDNLAERAFEPDLDPDSESTTLAHPAADSRPVAPTSGHLAAAGRGMKAGRIIRRAPPTCDGARKLGGTVSPCAHGVPLMHVQQEEAGEVEEEVRRVPAQGTAWAKPPRRTKFACKLNLDLDVEVHLNASIRGSLLLELGL